MGPNSHTWKHQLSKSQKAYFCYICRHLLWQKFFLQSVTPHLQKYDSNLASVMGKIPSWATVKWTVLSRVYPNPRLLQKSEKPVTWPEKFLWLPSPGCPKVVPRWSHYIASSHSLPIRGDSIAPDWMRLRNAVVRRDGGTHMRRGLWHCDRAA